MGSAAAAAAWPARAIVSSPMPDGSRPVNIRSASGARMGTGATEPRDTLASEILPSDSVTETAALTNAMSTTVRATRL